MSNIEFVMGHLTKLDEKNPLFLLKPWIPGKTRKGSLWAATKGELPRAQRDLEIFDYLKRKLPSFRGTEFNQFTELPTAFMRVGDKLYVGLSSGYVEVIDLTDARNRERYGPRSVCRYDGIVEAPIVGFAHHEDTVYDASAGGLYTRDDLNPVDDRQIRTVEVIDNRLCIVPEGLDPRKLAKAKSHQHVSSPAEYGIRESQAGHLIDVATGEVLMENVDSYEFGAGKSPGRHITIGDTVVSYHTADPLLKITLRDLKTGSVLSVVDDYGHSELPFEHNGQAYDLRRTSNGQEVIISSTEGSKDFRDMLFRTPKGEKPLSVVSAGKDGVFVALYNGDKVEPKTRIVNTLHPEETVDDLEGVVNLYAV